MSPDDSKGGLTGPKASWPEIINVVKSPLGFFTLMVLVVDVGLIGAAVLISQEKNYDHEMVHILVGSAVGLLFLLVILVAVMATFRPEALSGTRPEAPVRPAEDIEMKPSEAFDSEVQQLVDTKGADVLFAHDVTRPLLGFWFYDLRPYLHQAAHYSVPTYYLDNKLNVIDWNIAFEIVFAELIGRIRGKHVNWFIARMANNDTVFDHARQFTQDVIEHGAFPYVDVEPIEYDSTLFGLVKTLKVATLLTDTNGEGKAWAVALYPRQINWEFFQEQLYDRIAGDKRWSIYSASYDRVLLEFPPYHTLIDDVISVVPSGNLSVADLGAGTGNVTAALEKHGHRVTAIEDNLGMLDRFAAKGFDPEVTKLIKASVEHLEFLPHESFDAAVMVNVLYSLDHPLECLRSVHRILRPGGVLGLSTTHRETKLDRLLNSIEAELKNRNLLESLASDWETVYNVNRNLEQNVVRRYTCDEVREMLALAGFEIIKDVPSTYEEAVMLVHARKPTEASD